MEPLLEVDEPVVKPDGIEGQEMTESAEGSVRPSFNSTTWFLRLKLKIVTL